MTVTVIFEGATHADIVNQVKTWLATVEEPDRLSASEAIEQGAGLYKDALRIIATAAPRPVAENEIVKSLTDMGYRATDVTKDRLHRRLGPGRGAVRRDPGERRPRHRTEGRLPDERHPGQADPAPVHRWLARGPTIHRSGDRASLDSEVSHHRQELGS